jgi:hypothetical protein
MIAISWLLRVSSYSNIPCRYILSLLFAGRDLHFKNMKIGIEFRGIDRDTWLPLDLMRKLQAMLKYKLIGHLVRFFT